MKTNLSTSVSTIKKISLCVALLWVSYNYAQITYSFTNAGATGSLGPTQSQINSAYLATNLNGKITSYNGIQSFTVPATGPYKITTNGAQGGGNGGFGAQMEGEFNLIAGQVLNIVVGQQGINGTGATANNNGGGGGGGSFVVLGLDSLLIVAAGGGGGLMNAIGGNGLTTTAGQSTYFGGAGDNGEGGHSGITNGDAAGGAGFISDGQNSFNLAQSVCEGGKSFLNGATGGQSGTNGIYYGGAGGFGGGGSGWHNSINRCGGGGGYSGGQGGTLNSSPASIGGGGGSFNSGNNQVNLAGINPGNGSVEITFLYGVTIAQTSTIQCYNLSTAALSSTINGGTAPYTYSWLPYGGNSAIASNLSAGVYTLVVVDNNNLVTSITHTISQPAPFVVSATSNNSVVCKGESVILNGEGADIYSWTNEIRNGISFSPNHTSSYTVTGTQTLSGCSSTATIAVTVGDCTNLAEQNKNEDAFKLYPNPTTGVFQIEMKSGFNINKIKIYDVTGRIVIIQETNEDNIKLDISKFDSGVYYLQMGEMKSYKIIKA